MAEQRDERLKLLGRLDQMNTAIGDWADNPQSPEVKEVLDRCRIKAKAIVKKLEAAIEDSN